MTEAQVKAGNCENCGKHCDNLLFARRYDGVGVLVCSEDCSTNLNAYLMGAAWARAAKKAYGDFHNPTGGIEYISSHVQECKPLPTEKQIEHLEKGVCLWCDEEISEPLPEPDCWGFCGFECQAESEIYATRKRDGVSKPRFAVLQNGQPVAFDDTPSGARVKMRALALADNIRAEAIAGARVVPGVHYSIYDRARKRDWGQK